MYTISRSAEIYYFVANIVIVNYYRKFIDLDKHLILITNNIVRNGIEITVIKIEHLFCIPGRKCIKLLVLQPKFTC